MQLQELPLSQLDQFLLLLIERSEWLENSGKPMWNRAFLTEKAFLSKYPDPCLLGLQQNGSLIGGCILLEKDDFLWKGACNDGVWYIHKLFIRPSCSGKGYADMFLQLLKKYAVKQGVHTLRLDFYEDRSYLRSLYTRNGFKPEAVQTMPDGIRIVQMECQLSPC